MKFANPFKSSLYLKIFVAILATLFIARLVLPYALIRYAENRINKIPDYKVKIADLDVHLYRGSYTIKGIALYKVTKNIPVPFFSAESIDLSIQWRALLRGALVAKIMANKPTINFVMDPQGKEEQLSIDKEWQRAVKALFPLNFNRIGIKDGKLTLRSFKGNPPFNLFLTNIDLHIENMQKIDNTQKKLASTFSAQANDMSGGKVTLKGSFDPFSRSPTFSLNGSIKAMQINRANDFLQHFTKVDVKKGNFSLYLEAVAANGKIHGYAKPFIRNLKILDTQEKMNPVEFLYKGALELVSKIVTNPQKQTIATKIKIEGDIDEPDTSTLSIIGYLLRHAFIQALLPQVDHTIKMQDVSFAKNRVAMRTPLNSKQNT